MAKRIIRLEKKKIEKFCKKHHITYFALFGSVLTPHFTKKSDIDVLIYFDKKYIPHLFGLVQMESELSQLIGYQVDLRTPNDLSPYFRNEVLDKAMILYGK